MAGLPAAYFFVRGILDFSAGVAGGYLQYAVEFGEDGFSAPEAPVCQCGDFGTGQGGIGFTGAVFHDGGFGGWGCGLGAGR